MWFMWWAQHLIVPTIRVERIGALRVVVTRSACVPIGATILDPDEHVASVGALLPTPCDMFLAKKALSHLFISVPFVSPSCSSWCG
jgi:hypothetical protein